MKHAGKSIENIMVKLSIAFLSWGVLSYFNIILNNLSNPDKIWNWNLFKVLINVFGH